MGDLCQYSKIFGEPNKGAHKYRIGGFAAVDLIGTGVIALLITFAFHNKNLLTFILIFLILIISGILLHKAFCVNTKLNSIIYGSWNKSKVHRSH